MKRRKTAAAAALSHDGAPMTCLCCRADKSAKTWHEPEEGEDTLLGCAQCVGLADALGFPDFSKFSIDYGHDEPDECTEATRM